VQPASLSRIITRRALDLVAISLVLIVGLTAGREIISWWQAESHPASEVALSDPQIAWGDRPLDIQFGESNSYARLPFRGPSADALAELIRQLKQRLAIANRIWPPITADEQAWVTSLSELTPREVTDSGGQIILVPAMFPTIAATVPVTEQGVSTTRLAGWGMALPVGEEAWTLLVFNAEQGEPAGTSGITLPAGAVTLFGWSDPQGHAVKSFHGRGRLSDWLAHFDTQFGPRISAPNVLESDIIHARWRQPDRQIEIQLSQNGNETTGLLWITATYR